MISGFSCTAFPLLLGWSSLKAYFKQHSKKSSWGEKRRDGFGREVKGRTEAWLGARKRQTFPLKGFIMVKRYHVWDNEKERKRPTGKGSEQHDVGAFFLDGGCSPQKSSPRNSGTRDTLWFKECPKSHCCQSCCISTNSADWAFGKSGCVWMLECAQRYLAHFRHI